MARRIYHKKKSSGGFFKAVLAIGLCLAIGWLGYKTYCDVMVFHPQKLVENSSLKAEGFSVPVVEITSREGIKAYYFEDHTNPIISMSFLFKNSGTAYDENGQFGISNMAAALLTEGTESFDAEKFKEIVDDKAIQISFGADVDDFYGSLLTLKNNQKIATDLLKSVLTEASFNRNDIQRVRRQMLLAIDRQTEYPQSLLNLVWAQDLYQNHPYARNPIGKKADIKNIGKEQLQNFVQNNLAKQNLIVGIAGDISRQDAEKLLDKVFGSLPEKTKSQPYVADAKLYFDGHEKNVQGNLPQVVALFTAQGVARNHPDFYPLYIANQIFGGSGLNSRVSKAAREDKALTYGVGSYLFIQDKADLIKGGFSTTPDKYKELQDIVLTQWQNMGQGVTKEEFNQAKNYMIASYNLRFASLADIASMLVAMQKENLGIDFLQKRNAYVNAVSFDDVNNAAQKYFGKDNLIWTSIGSINVVED